MIGGFAGMVFCFAGTEKSFSVLEFVIVAFEFVFIKESVLLFRC